MLSGKSLRSSIILIPVLVLLPDSVSGRPEISALGAASRTGPIHSRQSSSAGLFVRWKKARLALDKSDHPLSLELQRKPWTIQAGTRFRPGPSSGFYVDSPGLSYLYGIPDRTSRPMGFLSLRPQSPGFPMAMGLGAVEGLSGAGLLLSAPMVTGFYHPGSRQGFLSWAGKLSSGNRQQSFRGSIYRDNASGGFGRYRMYNSAGVPFLLQVQGARDPQDDINPETQDPYPGRKGRSGAGLITLNLSFLELTAAGQDRGRDQYRLGRFRLLGTVYKDLQLVAHGQTLRTGRYGSDAGYRYFRNAGAGIRWGHASINPQDSLSLRPRLVVQGILYSDGDSVAGEISVDYKKGPFRFFVGYMAAHKKSPVSVFQRREVRSNALAFYPDVDHLIKFRLSSRNFHARVFYSESRPGTAGGKSDKFFRFSIQGRWRLQKLHTHSMPDADSTEPGHAPLAEEKPELKRETLESSEE
ncbi:MAG: hypothetical protein CMN76_09635 [Spirochaetaceae bacterium]|nr:hypothetical protein [Spirochaetaceae bacterium]|tara:strand:- start:93163 stop:94569 length:1407 start_codon:yes stop_codon:yes gene_type:complete